jgi:hypothetical protein
MPIEGKRVEPNMKYLHALRDSGLNLTDFEVLKLLPDNWRITVHDDLGVRHEFIIECPLDLLRRHHWEAIEFTGYGPRGLGNYIHADVCQKAKELDKPLSAFHVNLSPDLCAKLGDHLAPWTYYEYSFHIDPSLSGTAFTTYTQSE